MLIITTSLAALSDLLTIQEQRTWNSQSYCHTYWLTSRASLVAAVGAGFRRIAVKF
jgi:hypothetical protein